MFRLPSLLEVVGLFRRANLARALAFVDHAIRRLEEAEARAEREIHWAVEGIRRADERKAGLSAHAALNDAQAKRARRVANRLTEMTQ